MVAAVGRYGEFVPSIGLEVHATVKSESKAFSRSATRYNAPVNSIVSPFDASLPGSLPVLSRHCIRAAVRTGLALKCRIPEQSSFQRKHYFYADMPLGFQITQRDEPIATSGYLDFVVCEPFFHTQPYVKRAHLIQIQLEQDTGKTLHGADHTLIDLNRAGNPLLELVFAPDLSDGQEAAALIRDLLYLLWEADTCICRLDEGSVRVDANVSVRHKDQQQLGTRTEVKNLNSMTAITRAIECEIRRQVRVLESGGEVVRQTMRFNGATGETEVMRLKEGEDGEADYRFMPEGNLPTIRLTDSALGLDSDLPDGVMDINECRDDLPLPPQEQRVYLMQKYSLDLETAMKLLPLQKEKQWFIYIMDQDLTRDPALVFRVLAVEMMEALDSIDLKLDETPLTPDLLSTICDMVQKEEISFPVARDIICLKARHESRTPAHLVQDYGWGKLTDDHVVRSFCQQVIDSKPKRAKEVTRAGKKFAFDVLVRAVLAETCRRVDQETVERTLIQMLEPPDGLIKSGKQRKLERDRGLAVVD